MNIFINPWKKAIKAKKLYFGDITSPEKFDGYIGVSLNRSDSTHIKHNVTVPFPVADNTFSVIQAEDVLEHIEFGELSQVLDEIYRILEPGGYFRLSLPDYRSILLRDRCLYDSSGRIVFDPGGGGAYSTEVEAGGHLWFPNYEKVQSLLKNSPFQSTKIEFLQFIDSDMKHVCSEIDYTKGFIKRTCDNDDRLESGEVLSIIVDCYK